MKQPFHKFGAMSKAKFVSPTCPQLPHLFFPFFLDGKNGKGDVWGETTQGKRWL